MCAYVRIANYTFLLNTAWIKLTFCVSVRVRNVYIQTEK